MIDLDVVANLWAGERVSIEQLKQKEGYVAITDGHSKVHVITIILGFMLQVQLRKHVPI